MVLEEKCYVKSFVGNGVCEDFANTLACEFDGGDCCRPGSLKTRCKDCECKEDKGIFFRENITNTIVSIWLTLVFLSRVSKCMQSSGTD